MSNQHLSHESAMVGDGADCHCQLQWRDREALAHWNLGDRDFIPVLHRVHGAAYFTGKRDARVVAKAEVANVLVEAALTELHADFGRADVRGPRDDLLDRQIAKMMA